MRVILRTDIEKLGKLGDVVDVKPGYARNYLLPKKLAMLATPSNLKVFEHEKKKLEEKLNAVRFQAKELAAKLESEKIEIFVRVGEGDKLYGSVTSSNIVDELRKRGFEIDRKKVELDKPIRSLGDYQVPVKLYPGVVATLNVSVVRYQEEGDEQANQGE
ncbi:50S ribosomal protein L9 [Desulfothermus okinawensis JCM 13304]